MKIKGITVRLPPLLLGLVILFATVCLLSYGTEKNIVYIAVGLPLCAVLIGFPLFAMYTNEKRAKSQEPAARAMAKYMRAKQITPSMRGTAVIIEGTVVKVSGLLMAKPVYVIDDGSAKIIVKRFALPDPLLGVGAPVEVLGTVFSKMTNASSVYINALTIKPVSDRRAASEESETIRIKKFN